MEVNALLMGLSDNVVTCIADIEKGQTVCYRKGDEMISLVAEENIPYCHKIALEDISSGREIIKYDEPIGKLSEDVRKGHWVAHHNLFSIPRDYNEEMIKEEER